MEEFKEMQKRNEGEEILKNKKMEEKRGEHLVRSSCCGDGCDLVSTLCNYDLRKGDLFVLSCARVRRVRSGSVSSELVMCGGGMRSILLFLFCG